MLDPINSSTTNESIHQDNNNQIDAIRNIIFGSNMENYEQRFKKLHKLILTQKTDLEREQNRSNTEILEAIQDLDNKLSRQIRQNKEELLMMVNQIEENKLERKLLGKLLIEIGQKISI